MWLLPAVRLSRPICRRNSPARVNLSARCPPPVTQTLSRWSTCRPCSPTNGWGSMLCVHGRPWSRPPQAWTRFPSGSNSTTGGAGTSAFVGHLFEIAVGRVQHPDVVAAESTETAQTIPEAPSCRAAASATRRSRSKVGAASGLALRGPCDGRTRQPPGRRRRRPARIRATGASAFACLVRRRQRSGTAGGRPTCPRRPPSYRPPPPARRSCPAPPAPRHPPGHVDHHVAELDDVLTPWTPRRAPGESACRVRRGRR